MIRRLIPEPVLGVYHYTLARVAAILYRHPSEELIVIGVTGTNGKSSTIEFLGRILESAGARVGWTSTAGFKVADREWENAKKMTMLGRFQTQRLLREMVREGCQYAIVETSSQGIAQSRHIGINYDIAVFTNLTPEHIEAHGGFENYKQAKGKLFSHTVAGKKKVFSDRELPKSFVINIDDDHAPFFLSFGADRAYGYGIEGSTKGNAITQRFVPLLAEHVVLNPHDSTFEIGERAFELHAVGRFNVYNALAAISVCRALDIDWQAIEHGVRELEPVPGRIEPIQEGQPFSVIVDYAYEPAALAALYDALSILKVNRVIHVTGSAGGGRDVARREIIGHMAAAHDDVVIVTNEDPYDEDPMQIINDVADAAKNAGKVDGTDLFRILDRQEAIDKAIMMADKGDLVLITGKGSEPVMAVANGHKMPWDDRDAARRALQKL